MLEKLGKLWERQRDEEIWRRLDDALKKNIKYGEDPALSFPGTNPLPISVEAYAEFAKFHPNNILCHTRKNDPSEQGFSGTQNLEREMIAMLGVLCGQSDGNVDGYITSGGTEANIMGLWIGRNKLLSEHPGTSEKDIAIITSWLTHYSIINRVNLLGFGKLNWQSCQRCGEPHIFSPYPDGHGLHLIGTNEKGELLTKHLSSYIQKLYRTKEIKLFLIVLNAGTTMLGSVDDIPQIIRELQLLKEKLGIDFYVHVDAAFAGFVIPFVNSTIRFGFDAGVDSVTIDPHKIGLAPYPAGAFLCRKGLQSFIDQEVSYICGHSDDTLIGSRPGASAAACYAVMKSLGEEGYTKIMLECMEKTRAIRELWIDIPRLRFFASPINFATFYFEPDFEIPERIWKKYILYPAKALSDFSNIESCPRYVYKMPVMPHANIKHYNECKKDLLEILKEGLPA